MKNMHNIPTTVILLFFSWLVFIAGTCLAVYFYILDFGNAAQLFKALCLFLSSIFVSALIRAFANLGQLLFDSKQIQERVNSYMRQQQNFLQQALGQAHSAQGQLNAALLSFQEQFKINSAEIAGNLKTVSGQLQKHSDLMSQSFASLQEQSRNHSAQISRDLQLICQQLQAQSGLIFQEVKMLKEAITTGILEDVGGLKGNIEQIGCDSRDINEGVSQIKTFFELIERHLDLKK